MADMGSGIGQKLDVVLGQPRAVADSHHRPEHPVVSNVVDRRTAAPAPGVLLLVGGLQEMHVHRRTMLLRQRVHRFQRPVRTPVQVAWRELDPGALAVLVLRAGVREESELLVERQRIRLEKVAELPGQLVGQAAQELVVALVDDPVSGHANAYEYDTRMPMSWYASSTRPITDSTWSSGRGTQPCRCCTVVTPDSIISNAEYSVSR